ncbi:conserved hypothetical protein [Culex quinquefasciatus]|uniref:NEDD8 ultimate buster 1 n=1 Tax=Culex quinquefasciatus TaxID=7176 RepID=B0WDV6_CULQU|nr:conserved hypothetical protein [Culex quinquefasciatus]|eukprot:XP_001846890.1 conserved hypothetical protein [Culex quinquefasciatus]
MTTTELEDENYVIQIRAKLNEKNVKLWELPFYNPSTLGPSEPELEKLAKSFHEELSHVATADCLNALRKLQQNALDRLKSKDEFTRTGVATLRVRAPTQGAANRHFDVKCKTADPARELATLVAAQVQVDVGRIKLVSAGKVLQLDRTLAEQNVRNGATVMALVLMQSAEAAQQESTTFDRVHKIRSDAEKIIDANDRSDFLSLEDQDGNALHLPKAEKKALLMALTLYEKGKAALRKENFEEALLLFLEADSDFRLCNSQLLNVVDNYALLNLDIAWTYLCLKNINQLPDAEQRLRLCEDKFRQSYGDNMRRVTAIKGTQQCSEKALLLRLHLLKAVLFFHQNKREEAEIMFQVVETELQSLRVDDGALSTLLDCGFELTESRIALRACSNNLETAIEFINSRRETVTANEKKSKRERDIYKRIGHSDENRINIELVDRLVEMGFSESLAAVALRKNDNDLVEALNDLQSKPDSLKTELAAAIEPCLKLTAKLVDLGFHEDVAKAVLKQTLNNFDEAVEILVTARENNEYDSLLATVSMESSRASSSSSSSSSAEPTLATTEDGCPAGPSRKKVKNEAKSDADAAKKEMMDILYKSFSKDIDSNSEAYLDLPLVEEATILEQYKKLLNMK